MWKKKIMGSVRNVANRSEKETVLKASLYHAAVTRIADIFKSNRLQLLENVRNVVKILLQEKESMARLYLVQVIRNVNI